MAVFRVHKNKDYTTMSNYHLRDINLSLKAKGLLSLMLSLPEDWDYSVRGLEKICTETKDTINGILNELKKNNYLVRRRIYCNGKISRWEYDIYESNLHPKKQDIENQDIEKQDIENQDINKKLNNKRLNNKKLNNKEIHKESYGVYKRIKLTIDEYLRLVNDYGEDFIKQQIDLLDEYVESNNNKNKYTNFNLVLRKSIRENWFKKKGESSSFLETMKNEYDNKK